MRMVIAVALSKQAGTCFDRPDSQDTGCGGVIAMCTLIPSCGSRALLMQMPEQQQQQQQQPKLQQQPPSSLPSINPTAEVGEQHLCWGAAVVQQLGVHRKRPGDCAIASASGIDVRNVVCEAWAKVLNLNLEFVELEDNFFDAGGHWDLAVEIAEEISSSYGIPASAQDLCSTSTLGDFIQVLVKNQRCCTAVEDE